MQKHRHVKTKVQNKEGYSSTSQGPTKMASRPSELGERRGQVLLHSLRQNHLHQHLISASQPQEPWEDTFLFSKPPNLWNSVATALAK